MNREITVCMAALQWAKLTRSVLKGHLNQFQRPEKNESPSLGTIWSWVADAIPPRRARLSPPPPIIISLTIIYRGGGEEHGHFWFHLFVFLFTDLSQISPSALCLGLPGTKPGAGTGKPGELQNWGLFFYADTPRPAPAPPPPHPPKFSVLGISEGVGDWGSLMEPCIHTSCDPLQTCSSDDWIFLFPFFFFF